jgi:hypothetical protein
MQPTKGSRSGFKCWDGDAAYRSAAFRSAPWDRVSVAINRLDGQNFSAPTGKWTVFEYPFDFALRWNFKSVEHPPV